MKKIAVVILNYNGLDLLKKFIPTIVEHSTELANIYLADNASNDASIAWIETQYPEITCIKLNKNWGYAQGYNQALKNIKESYLCLLNSDVEVTANWLCPIIELFENQKQIGIIQPKILDYKNKNKFEYAGAAGGYIDALGFPYCRGRLFDTLEEDQNQYDSTEIFWASGACFFVRNHVFKQLHGFDQNFFAHQEEIDFCWRAFNTNIKTYYCKDSIVYHIGGASLQKSNPKKTYLNFRNSLIMLHKNLPPKNKFWVIFKRMCYDGLASYSFLFQGNTTHFLSVAKAHFAFYAYLLFNKNKQHYHTPKKEHYYQHPNIVKSYFLHKKRTFNEL